MVERDALIKVEKTMRMVLTIKQRAEIIRLLDANCEDVDGLAVYAPDWNDDRIAKEVGISRAPVEHIRKELIGKIRPNRPAPFDAAAEIAALKARVEALEGKRTWRSGFLDV